MPTKRKKSEEEEQEELEELREMEREYKRKKREEETVATRKKEDTFLKENTTREFIETEWGTLTVYVIPEGTIVYHGSHTLKKSESYKILERPNWFSLTIETAENYLRREEGDIHVFRLKKDAKLVALDICKNINILQKANPRWLRGFNKEYRPEEGWNWPEVFELAFQCDPQMEEPLRFSQQKGDQRIVKFICKLGLDGYASGTLTTFRSIISVALRRRGPENTIPGGFHPEIFLCNPREFLEIVETD